MHNQNSVGLAKVESGKTMLQNLNPHIQVNAIQEKATVDLLEQLLPYASVVLDCSDNFTTRHMVNAACVKHQVPLISGAAIKFDGQVTVIDPRQTEAPCYACLFPADQEFNEVQCSTMGVFSPLVGIIGSIQASQALQVIMQIGEPLVGKLLLWDARSSQVDQITLHKRDDCPVCSKRQ
jgi:molybdopterin/thiamine biosynthesis adenylyltransferase